MPYFKWVGVDSVGVKHRGKHPARSEQDLSEQLFKRGIGLMRCSVAYAPSFFWPISSLAKGNLFKQKSKLLRAGLMLPTVLEVVAEQSCNPFVYDALANIIQSVEHGASLGHAFEKHPMLTDPIVTIMLTAGHESGNIVQAMENVALYFHKQHLFNKSIRSVLAMPILTLLFFIGISLFIITCIIPRFAEMFTSMQQELPPLTRYMIKLSDFVCSSSMGYVSLFFLFITIFLYHYFSTRGKFVWDKMLARIPYVKNIVWQYYMGQSLQALSLLVNSGVTLVAGLKIIEKSIDHSLVKFHFMILHDAVESGQLLSNAMMSIHQFSPEVIALIHVGQESGALGLSIESASLVYTESVEGRLKSFIFILQPLVIIILGLLVMTLIFAIYLPIMQLSHAL